MEAIYKLVLGQEAQIGNHLTIMRVPGGWIFTKNNTFFGEPDQYVEHSTFVPFDNEFQNG
jgi:hypothetical protein|tara:strand:+ start:214 stop:393 length:180 start_codon:yes stop_codon:yes gene_type:complete